MKKNIDELMAKIQLKKEKGIALGLDIGTDSVKLVELVREGETIKLSKVDSAKITREQTGLLQQSELIKRVVANLLAKNNIKTKEIILGLSGQSVFMKFLDILPVSAEKLAQTIKYEAQQQIPFSLEEVEWDAHMFSSEQKDSSSAYRVLLVAVKKEWLAGKSTLVEGLKLHPSVLDVSSLSLYNCARFNQDYDENNLTCILNIGAQSTDLLVTKGDSLWMRSFAFGGDGITAALVEKFKISFADAEKLKARQSIDSPDVKEAVGQVLENLCGEITRSIEYYCFQQKQGQSEQAEGSGGASAPGLRHIDEIVLSGGTCRLLGLDKFLAENFSCQVRNLEPFKMLRLDEEIKKNLGTQNKALFSQAVGLALRGLSQSYININLLKEQIKARVLSRQRFAFAVSSAILALVVLLGAATFMRQDYREKSLRLQHLKGLLSSFSRYQPQIKELQKKEQLLSAQTDSLRTMAVNRALWLEVLSQLQKMLPDDLWITELGGSVSFDAALEKNLQSKLDLQGKAVSYEGVNDFVSRLKSSALFSEVKPLSSSFIEEQAKEGQEGEEKEKVEVVKFSVSMKVIAKNMGNE